jgi:histidine triad (HIT) family protein
MAGMAAEDAAAECFVCRKHRDRGSLLPGGPVGEDDLVIVSHLAPDAPGRSGRPVYLGHLFVEPRRHAPGLADLTDAEARAVGWWCTRASRALREAAGAEHVYAAVIGDGVPHLHVHLVPRYPGTLRAPGGRPALGFPCQGEPAGDRARATGRLARRPRF